MTSKFLEVPFYWPWEVIFGGDAEVENISVLRLKMWKEQHITGKRAKRLWKQGLKHKQKRFWYLRPGFFWFVIRGIIKYLFPLIIIFVVGSFDSVKTVPLTCLAGYLAPIQLILIVLFLLFTYHDLTVMAGFQLGKKNRHRIDWVDWETVDG